jgi:hypothetical protein
MPPGEMAPQGRRADEAFSGVHGKSISVAQGKSCETLVERRPLPFLRQGQRKAAGAKANLQRGGGAFCPEDLVEQRAEAPER